MGQSHGFDNTVVVAVENEFAVAPTTNYNWVGIVESFEPEESNNVDQRMSVGVRAPLMLRQGAKEVDGSMTVALQNARLLAYALGYAETTGDSTEGYTHAIRPIRAGEELPSLTVQNHNPAIGLTRNYVGGKVDSMTLSASAEEAVTLDVDFVFSHVEDSGISPATVTAELQNYFMFYEGSVLVNGEPVADITEFELELGNGLERRFTLNGKNRPERIEEGNLEVSSSLTMDFTSKAHWDAFQNGDSVTFELTLQDQDDPNHSITVTLANGMYDTNSVGVTAEDLQEQELEAVFTDVSIIAVDGNSTLI